MCKWVEQQIDVSLSPPSFFFRKLIHFLKIKNFTKRKQMMVSAALKGVCLKPTRKSAYLGHLTHEVGCKYQAVAAALEREDKAKIHYQEEKLLVRLWNKGEKNMEKKSDKYTELLKTHGLLV